MTRYFRKVIKIRAEDSPNVRSGCATVPGVLTREEYEKRLATWDKIRICVGISAEFYEGAEVLLYPPMWIDMAHRRAAELRGRPRQAVAIGVDPAEGGDRSAYAVVDRHGLIELISRQTPDTSVVCGEVLALARKYNVKSDKIIFDRGGGGKEHADRLRKQGHDVQTVAFGEAPSLEIRYQAYPPGPRREMQEERYAYRNRRSELYGTLRLKLDPVANPEGFGIPAEYTELRRQMAPIPLAYDEEGRLELPSKRRKTLDQNNTNLRKPTLMELIGCSPDELDSVVLAVWGLDHEGPRRRVGALT